VYVWTFCSRRSNKMFVHKKLEIVGICITHDDYFVPLSGLLLGCEIARGFFAIEDCSD
jgi:RsiW-degrading membrane proteinase PrsW (M82 family)